MFVEPRGKVAKLKVIEALNRDIGKWRARLPRTKMAELELITGDVIAIRGRSLTAAFAWPDRTAQNPGEDENFIRLDKILRDNAGVDLNDYVEVFKVSHSPAKKVVLAPYSISAAGSATEFTRDLRLYLKNMPLVEGNVVYVPVFGRKIPYVVVETEPKGVVIVSEDTIIEYSPRRVKREKTGITYADIGGLDYAIQKIRELVELPLRHPEIFQHVGIDPPKGILLYGPPGTGKTLLAKAVANETSAYFIPITGPEIMSKYYGESEERLRRVFEDARRHAPAIIFIDEIDALAPKRSEVVGEVEKRVVAQLLALMDGLESRENIIVIGATNRINAIDPALRRPGRFDREIEIRVPNAQGRYEILKIHTRSVPLDDDVDLRKLAEMTHGYVGADLAALVREAAMNAIRRFIKENNINIESSERIPDEVLKKLKVSMRDFVNALKEVRPSALREIYAEIPNVRWSDIGGLEDVKRQLKEVVEWPMKYPEAFERMGIEPPKGILLYGPPGCGKTLLAKAVATESEANFIGIKGPELLSKWVGESERAVREVFRLARQVAPAVIFFDEIDALAPRRGMYTGDSGVSERVISQLLTEMDGLQARGDVIVIAATNRPDLLDPALLRPGRFDRLIYVPPPDFKARLAILRVHTRKMPLAPDVDLVSIAKRTEYYTGADLAALAREAAMNALRRDIKAKYVTAEDFEEALERIQPSLEPDLVKFYEEINQYFRKRRIVLSQQDMLSLGETT